MPFFTVKLGETLIGLAAKHGFPDAQTLLDLPENASLKAERPVHGILKAGDQVFIPSRRLKQAPKGVDATHTFTVKAPRAWLRLSLKSSTGKPWAGRQYELAVGERRIKGELGADGILEQEVPASTTIATLAVFVAGPEAQPERWQLAVGHLDPAGEVSGVQARLCNLGIDAGPIDDQPGPLTEGAIRAFRSLTGLEPTGAVDETLAAKLAALYDPAADEQAAFSGLEAADEEPIPAPLPVAAHVQLVAAPGKGGDTLRSRSWVEVELVGEDGNPIPGAKVELEVPGGRRIAGVLDASGRFRAAGFPAGACRISFPDLDKDAWVPLEDETPATDPKAAGESTAGSS